MRSRYLVLLALTFLGAGCGASAAAAPRSVAGVEVTLRTIRRDVKTGRYNDACRYFTASAIKVLQQVVAGEDCAQVLAGVRAHGGNIGPSGRPRIDVYGDLATASSPAGGGGIVLRYVDRRWMIDSPKTAPTGPARFYRVPAGAMEPTLTIGQKIIVVPLTSTPHVGDIVVFHPPLEAQQQRCGVVPPKGASCSTAEARFARTTFVKRIVAGPGDTVSIVEGHVVRNGKREPEPYIKPCVGPAECSYPTPITIPTDH
jgi:signal peptidase I